MLIDGKKLAQEVIEQLKKERNQIAKKIRLATILVGNNPASLSFIKQKEKVGKEIGVDFRLYQYPLEMKVKELRHQVGKLSRITMNRGVVVQLPLPSAINTQVVLNGILPQKDVDVLTETNLGKFYANRLPILPPVVAAINFILNKHQISLQGKNVLVIGQGKLVGKPVAVWAINQGATVMSANIHTKNLNSFMKIADVIITGAGKPNLISGEVVAKDVIIFDAAVMTINGKLRGDCDLDSLKDKAQLITPVPRGLGPLTVAFLYRNLLELTKEQK